jgi:8-oxo-dGTP pyrophosphatase MutT (NUDIX family)
VLYRGARIVWFFTRPKTDGCLVAAWHRGELLMVLSAYRHTWGLPGGSAKRGEDFAAAAAREGWEEIGLRIDPAQLQGPIVIRDLWENRDDTVHIFELELAEPPELSPDGREILEGAFFRPEKISALQTPPHLRLYLARRQP